MSPELFSDFKYSEIGFYTINFHCVVTIKLNSHLQFLRDIKCGCPIRVVDCSIRVTQSEP